MSTPMTAEIIEGYVLSPQQRQNWRRHTAPVSAAVRMNGPLELNRLQDAFRSVINRHEILRTAYPAVPGVEPLQSPQPELGSFRIREAGRVSNSVHDTWVSLQRLSDQSVEVALGASALNADIQSLCRVWSEVLEEYTGAVVTQPDAQYVQYSEYMGDWLASSEADARRSTWAQLDSGYPITRLPAEPSGAGIREESIVLPGSFTESACVAAWAAVLSRFTGSTDLRIAYEVNGRPYADLENMIGAFAHVVQLDIRIRADQAVHVLEQAIENQLEQIRLHQDGSLTTENLDREAPAVGFSWTRTPTLPSLRGCRIEWGALRSGLEPLAARLHAVEADGGTTLRLTWDASRHSLAQARTWLAAVRSVLEHAESPVATVPLHSSREQQELVRAWSTTEITEPDPTPVMDRIRRWALERPGAMAIREGERAIAYTELGILANQLAHALRAHGVGPEDLVAVVGGPSTDAVLAILGVLGSGAAFLPIDPSTPQGRMQLMLRDGRVRLVLDVSGPSNMSFEEVEAWQIDQDWFASCSAPSDDPAIHADARSAAYVIYTSGSTGTPKGVTVEHSGLLNYLDWCHQRYASDAALGAPLHSSLGFDLTITSLLGTLVEGRELVIAAGTEALDGALRSHRDFAWVKVTPTHAAMLGRSLGRTHLSGATRKLIVGGEALAPHHVNEWLQLAAETEIVNEYGPTEAVVGCAVWRVEACDGSMPIGRPIANARLYVLDGALQPVPAGTPGELYIGGLTLARGYRFRPDLTADRFVPDPFSSEAGARMYRSGDLARYRNDGELDFLGRLDHQIKVRGYRVELEEIEAVLGLHSSIAAAAVLQTTAGTLAAYVVPSSDSRMPGVSALRAHLAERLPEYMIPSLFVELPRLPLNANGKVDRGALPAPDAVKHGGDYVGPRSLQEEVLAEIWASVLDLHRVSIDDDYFLLGGDSIRAIQIAGRAGQRGLDVSLNSLFRHRTIRGLARAPQTSDSSAPVLLAPEAFCLVTQEDRAKLPEDAEDAYPLSALQSGMIFHRELHPESAIYHDIFGYHLRMPLDEAKLDEAARALVARHPVLRTSFHLGGFSEPLQIVHRTARSPLYIADLRHLSPDDQDQALRKWMEAEKARGFDYAEPPLLRFQIHRRTDDSFQFSLSFHHAIIDGWSDASMLVELAMSYQELLEGKAISFRAPQTKYREFVALERAALTSPEHREYWSSRLAGSRPLILPRWAAVKEADPGPRGVKLQHVPISAETSRSLRRMARELALPLKSVLMAAHIRVMSTLSGTTDVLTSLSSAGRPETVDGNQILGLHLNSTPIRIDAAGGSWADLIRQCFGREKEALPYRRFPLAEIQRMTGVRRLVETSFYYTHYHNVEQLTKLPQFEILGRMVYEETSFAMVANFNLDPFSGDLGLTLACDQTQFEADQRQWIGDYYERALVELVTRPEEAHSASNLTHQNEADRIARLSSGPSLEMPAEPVTASIRRQANASPDAAAVRCGDEQLTYAELSNWSAMLASNLASRGFGPGSIVGLRLHRSVEMIVGILGVLECGAAYLALDPDAPEERLQQIVEDACPAAVLSQHDIASLRPKSAEPVELPPMTVEMNDVAYVLYTSGSTGRPKGTVVGHASLAFSTASRIAYYRDPVRRYLLLSSFAFDSSVAGIFWTLCTGGVLILPLPGEQREADVVLALMELEQVTHVLALPSLYGALLESAGQRRFSLRVAIVAGEALSPSVVEQHFRRVPEAELFNEYGPTEATVWCSVERCDTGSVTIGTPIPGARLYVLDSAANPSPIGTPGELVVGGLGITHGYLNRAALTAAAFVPDPFSAEPGSRMYRTGDAVRRRSDGRLEFLGRIDRQVKIRGHRVELEEIEAVIRELTRENDVAVIAREIAPGDMRLVGYLSDRLSLASRERLRRDLASKLPEYMIPAQFVFMQTWPRTASGKLDRSALPEPDAGRDALASPYVAPSTPSEATLAEIWSKVLGVPQVGVNDDFFALGGDSIRSIQIIARAREAGLRFSPMDLFQQRTIAKLVPLAERQRPETPASGAKSRTRLDTPRVSALLTSLPAEPQ